MGGLLQDCKETEEDNMEKKIQGVSLLIPWIPLLSDRDKSCLLL